MEKEGVGIEFVILADGKELRFRLGAVLNKNRLGSNEPSFAFLEVDVEPGERRYIDSSLYSGGTTGFGYVTYSPLRFVDENITILAEEPQTAIGIMEAEEKRQRDKVDAEKQRMLRGIEAVKREIAEIIETGIEIGEVKIILKTVPEFGRSSFNLSVTARLMDSSNHGHMIWMEDYKTRDGKILRKKLGRDAHMFCANSGEKALFNYELLCKQIIDLKKKANKIMAETA